MDDCLCTQQSVVLHQIIACTGCGETHLSNCRYVKLIDRSWACMNCTAALLNQPAVYKKYAEYTNEQTTSHTQRNSDISLDLFTAPQEERPLLNNVDIDPDEHYFSKQPNSCR